MESIIHSMRNELYWILNLIYDKIYLHMCSEYLALLCICDIFFQLTYRIHKIHSLIFFCKDLGTNFQNKTTCNSQNGFLYEMDVCLYIVLDMTSVCYLFCLCYYFSQRSANGGDHRNNYRCSDPDHFSSCRGCCRNQGQQGEEGWSQWWLIGTRFR